VVDIGKSCKYSIYRITPDSLKREVLYQFYDNEFIYNHTLFLTENYVILYLGPLRAKPLDFLSKPISEVISYSKDAKCKFLIIERKTLQVTILDGPSFVVLHGANAFEQDGIINLDLVEYINNFEPYKKFYFENIKNNDCNLEMAVSRAKLNIVNSKIDKTIITKKACEFPRINERFLTKPYQYIYLSNRRENANFFNSIIKISLSDKSILEHDFGTDFVSEPIFIANPNSNQEDDGIIFVNVINITKKLSYIAYLNASDLSLIYKAYLPIQIPPTLHGIYLRGL
jgi:carotenoid cleavage dioxygenase-like enzyme